MKISETLLAMAGWLESPDNKALLASEGFPTCMQRVADAVVGAAAILKECAQEVDVLQGAAQPLLVGEAKQLLQALAATPLDQTLMVVALFDGQDKLGEIVQKTSEVVKMLGEMELPEDITATVHLADLIEADVVEKVAGLASIFDASSDVGLQKQASVIDELLLTISAPEGWSENFKAAQAKKLDEIKKLYQEPNEKLHEVIGVEDAKKAIEKSEYNKAYRIMESPLSMRMCPDHGSPMSRVATDTYQCPLDKKVYDWNQGFKDEKGNVYPPGGPAAVAECTKLLHNFHSLFDSRQDRINQMK